MSWLGRLDARAQHWPSAAKWPYLGVKWVLIVVGVYLAIGLAIVEFREGRAALGTGIAVAVIVAVIKGLFMAWTAGPPPPHQSDAESR